jgi:hypothetical protein
VRASLSLFLTFTDLLFPGLVNSIRKFIMRITLMKFSQNKFPLSGSRPLKRAEARAPERGVYAASTSKRSSYPEIIYENRYSGKCRAATRHEATPEELHLKSRQSNRIGVQSQHS